jgi:F-type H+-transporting ATPase subunit gamma
LNTNALRNSVARMKEWDAKGVGIDITVVGNKGVGFMQRMGANIVSQAAGMGDSPHLEKLIGPVQIMLEAYKEGRIDALYIIYSRFINTMKQESQLHPAAAPCPPRRLWRRPSTIGTTSTSPRPSRWSTA